MYCVVTYRVVNMREATESIKAHSRRRDRTEQIRNQLAVRSSERLY